MYRKDIAKTVQQPRKIFPKGHIITQEGEKGDRAWLVESGNVSITVHDTLIATVGEGAIVGEMALIDGGPRSATVQALREVTCQELNGSKFHRLLDMCSPLASCLLESLSDTIRRAQGLPQVMGRGAYHYIKSRPRGAEPIELKTFSSGSFIYTPIQWVAENACVWD
ncbi:MAG: cyclic nucleotide-binding domain-containing protein [Rhodospirillaceae bacterium]